MKRQRPKRVFLETFGASIDLKDLAILETVARKRRCSVEEIILEAVLRYSHRKSQPLSTEDDEDDRDEPSGLVEAEAEGMKATIYAALVLRWLSVLPLCWPKIASKRLILAGNVSQSLS